MREDKINPCPRGTVNSDNQLIGGIAAALADAYHAGGLSKAYYREADNMLEELARLIAELEEKASHDG